MSITKEVRLIVLEKVANLAEDARVVTRAGLDKEVWERLLVERMRTEEPQAHRVVARAAAQEFYRNQIRYFIRHTHVLPKAARRLLELEDSLRAAQRANEIVQLVQPNGEYTAKRYIDMTPLEADLLAEQYSRQSATLARKAAQLRADAKQARLAGLGDDEPFTRLLAA